MTYIGYITLFVFYEREDVMSSLFSSFFTHYWKKKTDHEISNEPIDYSKDGSGAAKGIKKILVFALGFIVLFFVGICLAGI